MTPTIRAGRPSDIAAIASWTTDTFDWGDYVGDALPEWMADPAGIVLVAEVEGDVVATGRVVMASATEAWAQGARVHPDHRRSGIGSLLSQALWDWAREHGAKVVRLAVEADNSPALAHVENMGFRRVSDWWFAARQLGARSPVPEGNGGRRVPTQERLQEAHSAEAEPAFLSWTVGELAQAARGLFSIGWVWRLMTVEHLEVAARNHSLIEGRPGWAITEPSDETVRVHWIETSQDDARAMVRALVDHGVEHRQTSIEIMAPKVEWLGEALSANSFDRSEVRVYALSL